MVLLRPSAAPRRILTLGAAGVGGQLITVAALPVLTRLYDPASFSVWTVLLSVSVLFTGIASLRYELAIVLPESGTTAANLLLLALAVAAGMAVVAAGSQTFFSTALVGAEFEADLRAWYWFVPAMVVATGVVQALLAWCTRTREFGWYAIGQAGAPAATVLGQLGAYAAGFAGAGGLLLGTLAGQVAVAGVLAALVASRYGGEVRGASSLSLMVASARTYRQYPLFVTPYTLTGTFRERAAYLLMTAFAARTQVGLYGVAARFVNMPNSLFSSALRPVFFQRATRSDFRSLEGFVTRVLRVLIIAVVPGWALLLASPGTIFAIAFGEEWREAGAYAALLSFPAFVLMITNWLDRAFDALGRQRLAFGLEVLFTAIGLAALLAGVFGAGSMLAGIALQSAALTLCYVGWLYTIFRIGGFDLRSLAGVVVTLAVGLLACVAALGGLMAVLPAPGALIVYGVVAAAAVFRLLGDDLRWLLEEGRAA